MSETVTANQEERIDTANSKSNILGEILANIFAFTCAFLLLLSSCDIGGRSLDGDWVLMTHNGEQTYRTGNVVTFSKNGSVYDTDDLLSYYFMDDYPVTGWETTSKDTLVLTGVLGDTCRIKYSRSGNKLTLSDSYSKLVLKKK